MSETSQHRAAFRAFAEKEIAPFARAIHENQETPTALIRHLAAAGYLGLTLPEAFGGGNQDQLTLGWLSCELGRVCSSVRSLVTVHSLVTHSILRWGTREQKQQWLPKLATGASIGAFALSEPLIGSDAKSVKTQAVRQDATFVLNGEKKWTTYGEIADVLVVFAQCEGGPTAFLVERDRPGVHVEPIRGLIGLRGAMAAKITFNQCSIPKENVVGRIGLGFSHVASCALDLGRFLVAWGALGIVQACIEACVKYTSEREQFGVAIKEHQLVRRLISDMYTNFRAARALCLEAGRLRDAKDPSAIGATATAKYFASTAAIRAADDAIQLHGANGCSSEYPLQRYFGDAKVLEIIEGSTQIQQITLAEFAYQDYRTGELGAYSQ